MADPGVPVISIEACGQYCDMPLWPLMTEPLIRSGNTYYLRMTATSGINIPHRRKLLQTII